jgi:hypothetical protein
VSKRGSQQATLFAFHDTLEGVECPSFSCAKRIRFVFAVVVVFAVAVVVAVVLAVHYKVSARLAYLVAAVVGDDAEPLLLPTDFAALAEPGAFFTRTEGATSSEGFAVRYCWKSLSCRKMYSSDSFTTSSALPLWKCAYRSSIFAVDSSSLMLVSIFLEVFTVNSAMM